MSRNVTFAFSPSPPKVDPGMGLTVENLTLTDFMDVPTLQEIQDSFAAVADVKATITDAVAVLRAYTY